MESKASQPADDPVVVHLQRAAAQLLWEAEAIRVARDEPFTLASGNRSPIYVDCRRMISEPHFMRLYAAAAALILARRDVAFDCIAGGETAGIPYASYLASALGAPCVYLRKKPKGYGTASRIEGRIEPGARVLLVEDLITDGGSKLSFLDAVAAVDARVHDALVLFDRQQGGDAVLATRDARLHAVIDRATAFEVGAAAGLVDEETLRSCRDYFDDAEAWHAARQLPFQE